jgi:hypothetical protein
MGIKTRRQRFNPSRSVKVLLASDKSSEDKIYELMRLLAWSLLERKTKQDRSYDVEMRRRELANDAGVYALAYLIHNERQKKRSRKLDSLMDSLDKIGGMLRVWYTDRSFDLFKDVREAHRDLRLVCDLVSFLCIHPPAARSAVALTQRNGFFLKSRSAPLVKFHLASSIRSGIHTRMRPPTFLCSFRGSTKHWSGSPTRRQLNSWRTY